jgi:hypothetical protein
MATPEVAPVINSAQQLEPGIAEAKLERNPVLPSQQAGALPFPPSNVFAEFIHADEAPNPFPPRVQFAALRDPVLRMVRAIPLDVSKEGSNVVVCWQETNEFGTGETLSLAIDDFASCVSDLYHRLFSPDVKLGEDLQKVRATLTQYIHPRK